MSKGAGGECPAHACSSLQFVQLVNVSFTYDSFDEKAVIQPLRALVGSFDRFTSIETNEGVQGPSGSLSGEGPASATFFGCPRRPKCRGTIGRGQNERCAPFAAQILW